MVVSFSFHSTISPRFMTLSLDVRLLVLPSLGFTRFTFSFFFSFYAISAAVVAAAAAIAFVLGVELIRINVSVLFKCTCVCVILIAFRCSSSLLLLQCMRNLIECVDVPILIVFFSCHILIDKVAENKANASNVSRLDRASALFGERRPVFFLRQSGNADRHVLVSLGALRTLQTIANTPSVSELRALHFRRRFKSVAPTAEHSIRLSARARAVVAILGRVRAWHRRNLADYSFASTVEQQPSEQTELRARLTFSRRTLATSPGWFFPTCCRRTRVNLAPLASSVRKTIAHGLSNAGHQSSSSAFVSIYYP